MGRAQCLCSAAEGAGTPPSYQGGLLTASAQDQTPSEERPGRRCPRQSGTLEGLLFCAYPLRIVSYVENFTGLLCVQLPSESVSGRVKMGQIEK